MYILNTHLHKYIDIDISQYSESDFLLSERINIQMLSWIHLNIIIKYLITFIFIDFNKPPQKIIRMGYFSTSTYQI